MYLQDKSEEENNGHIDVKAASSFKTGTGTNYSAQVGAENTK